MTRRKIMRYDVTNTNSGSNTLELLQANSTRLVMEEIMLTDAQAVNYVCASSGMILTNQYLIKKYLAVVSNYWPAKNYDQRFFHMK